MPALIAAAVLAAAPAGARYPDEAALLREIGYLRARPAAYASELRRIAGGYRGRYYVESDGTPHASIEGAAALDEAAAALDRTAPAPPLAADPILRAAARDQAEAQARSGGIGHGGSGGGGSGGDGPGDRVRRHGGDVYVSEVIAYGTHAAADVVRQLVVDDGFASRGHRRLLLSAAFRYAGAWCGPHPTQGTVCVVDLASGPGGRPFVPAQ